MLLSAVLLVPLMVSGVKAQPVIEPVVELPPELASQQVRVTAAAQAATTMLADWFGALPTNSLKVVGRRWQGNDAASSMPGAVSVPVRWIGPARDQSLERSLIEGVVRQYWPGDSPAGSFQEALVAYISTRAIHHILEGSNFAAPRFFGGHVSFPLRSVLLSPPVADPRPRVWVFDDGPVDHARSHRLRAFQTLERYVGWPTLLDAISSMRPAGPTRWTEQALGETLTAITGTNFQTIVPQCFSADVDYSVEKMDSRAASGTTETTIVVAGGGPHLSIPILVRFADGSSIRDAFDGATTQPLTLTYSANSAAVSAMVDPDAIVLLDRNRENNAIVRDASRSRLGVRLALHWLAWLQNAMLTYTAVV